MIPSRLQEDGVPSVRSSSAPWTAVRLASVLASEWALCGRCRGSCVRCRVNCLPTGFRLRRDQGNQLTWRKPGARGWDLGVCSLHLGVGLRTARRRRLRSRASSPPPFPLDPSLAPPPRCTGAVGGDASGPRCRAVRRGLGKGCAECGVIRVDVVGRRAWSRGQPSGGWVRVGSRAFGRGDVGSSCRVRWRRASTWRRRRADPLLRLACFLLRHRRPKSP